MIAVFTNFSNYTKELCVKTDDLHLTAAGVDWVTLLLAPTKQRVNAGADNA